MWPLSYSPDRRNRTALCAPTTRRHRQIGLVRVIQQMDLAGAEGFEPPTCEIKVRRSAI